MFSAPTMGRKSRKSQVENVDEVGGSPQDVSDVSEIEGDWDDTKPMSYENALGSKEKAREHMQQLQRLQEKDPEFYQFLKEHDKELLDFNEEDVPDESEADLEEPESQITSEEIPKVPGIVITSTMVDSWCNKIQECRNIGAIRSLMRAFRTACHYGDEGDTTKFSVMSSNVFNKIMLFVLREMDGVLRELLKLPNSGGDKETIIKSMNSKGWKIYGSIVKSYLGNALHVLNQMTDNEMISYTLRRLRSSAVFLAAFPNLLRKYIKVALHFWGTGGSALPVVSLLFLRDICIQIGLDSLDTCLKGIYKAYVLNCQFVSGSKLKHLQFLGNCVIELYRLNLPSSYQHAFIFIRQLAMILRDSLTMKTKEAFRKVYEWKFMNCLELWTGVICAFSDEADFKQLAYPLSQIIFGVVRLVPTSRYFPLRLKCVRMLNRIAASTGTFIPISALLLDMLDMKEFNRPSTGGVGKAVDLRSILKVSKPTLKTRAFQEACVYSVVEELAEHLAQWSYSIAFFELSFIPLVRLRSFCKATKVERFRREIRELVRQIEASSEFVNSRRAKVTFSPHDSAVASFLQVEKVSKASPLSQFLSSLHIRAQKRSDSMSEDRVVVGADSTVFNKMSILEENDAENREEVPVFNSSWLPGKDSKKPSGKKSKDTKKSKPELASDEDVVEDLVFSSDDEPQFSRGDEDEKRSSIKLECHKSKKRKSKKKKAEPRVKKPKINFV